MVVKRLNICNCYFNYDSYYAKGGGVDYIHFNSSKCGSVFKMYNNYQRAYVMLMHLLKDLKSYNVKNIDVYHDTRIIEEINSQITPLSHWGYSVLHYIHRNLIPYFIDCSFRKIASGELRGVLHDDLHIKTYVDPEKIVEMDQKRRFQRFKKCLQIKKMCVETNI